MKDFNWRVKDDVEKKKKVDTHNRDTALQDKKECQVSSCTSDIASVF